MSTETAIQDLWKLTVKNRNDVKQAAQQRKCSKTSKYTRTDSFKDVLIKTYIYLSYSLYHLELIVWILGFIYPLTIFLYVYFEQLMLITQFLLRVYFVSNIILIEPFKEQQ